MDNIQTLDANKFKIRPFIPLWNGFSNDFIELNKHLLYLIRRHGISKVGENQARKERAKFVAAVHDGWKEGQLKVSLEVITRLEEIEELEKNKKEAHQAKNKQKKESLILEIKVKKLEIKILRRFIDSIVWTLFGNEHSSIRRLPLADDNDNLSKKNIVDSMAAVNLLNEDPYTIAIASDLTTFVHAGDIVLHKMNEGTKLIEVKSGDKNISFSHAAQFSVESECPHFDDEFTKDFDEKDKKHYQRTKKQWERLTTITNTLNTGEGYDYYHKKQVKIEDKNFVPEFYTEKIVESWKKIRTGKLWDIHVVNECLFIGVYKNAQMGFAGFNSWMELSKVNGIIFNISDSMHQYFCQPLFSANLPDELIEDVISGDVIITLCLDYEKFMSYGNKKHINLFHLLSVKNGSFDKYDYFMIGKKAICTYQGGGIHYLGTGLESRIIFDFQTPDSIIEWTYKTSDLRKEKMRQKNNEKSHLSNKRKTNKKTAKRARKITRRSQR